MADYSNIQSSKAIKTLLTSILNNYSHEQLEQNLKSDKIIKGKHNGCVCQSLNSLFNTRQLHSTRILLYKYNGDKYTGIWDGWKGQGEVNYKDGNKYIGEWDWFDYRVLKRHGLGTLYSADGQALNQGKWDKDEYKGKE